MKPAARWPALITLMFVALAGPQGTLLPSAVELLASDTAQDPNCPASMCKTRECCCASPSETGCQVGLAQCPSSETVLPAVTKSELPPRLSLWSPFERPGSLASAPASRVDDGFDRRPERPPRAAS